LREGLHANLNGTVDQPANKLFPRKVLSYLETIADFLLRRYPLALKQLSSTGKGDTPGLGTVDHYLRIFALLFKQGWLEDMNNGRLFLDVVPVPDQSKQDYLIKCYSLLWNTSQLKGSIDEKVEYLFDGIKSLSTHICHSEPTLDHDQSELLLPYPILDAQGLATYQSDLIKYLVDIGAFDIFGLEDPNPNDKVTLTGVNTTQFFNLIQNF